VDAVRFEQVVKRFGEVRAVDGMSLRIAAGETAALLGPNGAGKSTAISLMLGLRRPDPGRVATLGGEPAAAVRAGRIGAMLQTGALPPGTKVGELVDCIRRLYPRPLPLSGVLARADLAALAHRRVETLSGGQAQRVRFALAMAGDPELVFLDEPTAAMDVASRRAFWESMRSFAAQGRTVLFATHYLDEADAVADRVIVLQHGQVIADGAPAAIRAAAGARTIRFTLEGDLPDGLPRRHRRGRPRRPGDPAQLGRR
jgi:ABC-2 type transport system ATP-binding protein